MRLKELDGLRGIAALGVVLGHLFGMLSKDHWRWLQDGPAAFLWNGGSAVMLFFALSGFVLALPYAAGKHLDLRSFYVRRVFRLYPAYWFAIGFSFLCMKFYQPENLAGLSTWASSFWQEEVPLNQTVKTLLMAGPGFDTHLINPPVWSLLIEMSVSVILPLIIVICLRVNGWLRWLGVALACVAFAYLQDRFRMLDLFAAGVLLAFYQDRIRAAVGRFTLGQQWGLLAIGTVLYSSNLLGLPELVRPEVTGLGSLLLIVSALTFSPFKQVLQTRPADFLGEVSYSLYLLHFPVMLITASAIVQQVGLVPGWIVTLGATLALSYLVYRFIELPFQAIGRKLGRSSSKKIAIPT
ncbi:acyltransferase [Deinococcus sp. Arct2-2]|uniref:acyltransferase family protein n=1 Tax=Deinococcus sp. Arct2-2 TaxID=2568653 RepID=UPI0010A50559|nr:acyltransferase [Deinococcus sp. Arct2-2]THF68049.1 acyltransferase [Deinococcus sp. Arct2-2]